MEIEILHIDACPNCRDAERLVSQVLEELEDIRTVLSERLAATIGVR